MIEQHITIRQHGGDPVATGRAVAAAIRAYEGREWKPKPAAVAALQVCACPWNWVPRKDAQ